jgi:hypothetical protein
MHAKRLGPKKIASVFTSLLGREYLAKHGQFHGEEAMPITLNDFITFSIAGFGEVHLEADPGIGLRIKIEPNSLINGLWIQLSRKLAGSTAMRTCRQCNALFEVGPGTSKRSDATFCCGEHSVLFHSLKRSKRK